MFIGTSFSYTSLRIQNTVIYYWIFHSINIFHTYSVHSIKIVFTSFQISSGVLFRCHINNNASYTVRSCPIRYGRKPPYDSLNYAFWVQPVCMSQFFQADQRFSTFSSIITTSYLLNFSYPHMLTILFLEYVTGEPTL
jgi:hypothetical protein